MDAKDIAEQALVFSENETVSKVTANMIKYRKQEAMIVHNEKIKGAVFANTLARGFISSPEKTKIGGFVEHVKPASPDTPIDDIIKTFLDNDYKSVPVIKNKVPFFITKLVVLEAVKNRKELKGKTAGDVMNTPHCISYDDSIATAVSVLRETGVSRLPVLSSSGSVLGIIDGAALLKVHAKKTRMRLGEEAGEKTDTGGARATALMKRQFPTVGQATSLKHVIETMAEKGMPTALVMDKDTLAGIITPKPIFRLFAGKPKEALVRLNGIRMENDYIKSVIDDMIKSEILKLGSFLPIDYLVMHVDRHSKSGRRKNYLVKARLITRKGDFFADDQAWDITKAVKNTLDKLEREILRKKGRERTHKRNP